MAYQIERKPDDASGGKYGATSPRPNHDLLTVAAEENRALDAPSTGAEVISLPNMCALPTRPLGGLEKRAFDVGVATLLILLAAPLLLFVALCTKVLSPGPLLFAHRRIGFRGAEFRCLKFRTMVTDAEQKLTAHLAANPDALIEWTRDQKLRIDPRVTWIGNILRKTSLDELPQLLNVIRGDMSLVGPRPVVAEELERYGPRRVAYLSARPGMSGLWQVSGRNSTTYDRRTALDETYVRTWSMRLDLTIIARTVPEMLMSSHTS